MAAVIHIQPGCAAPIGGSRTRTRLVERPSAATYRRRRLMVGTTLAAFVAIGTVTTFDVLAGSGGDPASATESLPARSSVVAQPGDTLWSIASANHGEHSLTRYLDTLVDINGGATIQVGQQILLP